MKRSFFPNNCHSHESISSVNILVSSPVLSTCPLSVLSLSSLCPLSVLSLSPLCPLSVLSLSCPPTVWPYVCLQYICLSACRSGRELGGHLQPVLRGSLLWRRRGRYGGPEQETHLLGHEDHRWFSPPLNITHTFSCRILGRLRSLLQDGERWSKVSRYVKSLDWHEPS